ncbi:hypothetical protein ACFV1B_25155 [Streptomyces sp. NPDC059637]|uniref:hypothetical protein n=1 Tax=Streptomyces TaxID=1883 RepID=UPI0031DA565C
MSRYEPGAAMSIDPIGIDTASCGLRSAAAATKARRAGGAGGAAAGVVARGTAPG